MIERFDRRDDLDLLVIWWKAPDHAKPQLPFDGEKMLRLLQLCDRWLREHGGDRIAVKQMLFTHCKNLEEPISLTTAGRYVEKAMELFITYSPATTRWYTDYLLMECMREIKRAQAAGKHEAVARLMKEARGLVKELDQYILEDQTRNIQPIKIEAVFSLEEADIPDDPHIRERFAAWKLERERRRNGARTLIEGQDFTVENAT